MPLGGGREGGGKGSGSQHAVPGVLRGPFRGRSSEVGPQRQRPGAKRSRLSNRCEGRQAQRQRLRERRKHTTSSSTAGARRRLSHRTHASRQEARVCRQSASLPAGSETNPGSKVYTRRMPPPLAPTPLSHPNPSHHPSLSSHQSSSSAHHISSLSSAFSAPRRLVASSCRLCRVAAVHTLQPAGVSA